ncbi:hypothetical protein D3C78_1165110 [compost metagenome]
MAAFAGHQADALDPEHAGNRLQLGPQRLELQVDQVRAEQVDGVALLAADLAAVDVDAVFDEQVEDVAKDADAVLAVHLDAHGSSPGFVVLEGFRANFLHATRKFPSRICDIQTHHQAR